LSLAIVEHIAKLEDTEPEELTPPLYDVINPDALDTLFQPASTATLEFAFQGYTVRVTSDKQFTVHPNPE